MVLSVRVSVGVGGSSRVGVRVVVRVRLELV